MTIKPFQYLLIHFFDLLLYFIVPFFLGEKGVATCPGGYSVTDSATCELACNQLEMPIKGELSDGKLCYQNNGRKRKGCKQNGRNSHKARLVCENHGKYIFLHSKIKSIKGKYFSESLFYLSEHISFSFRIYVDA